ncbi:hypothetical protein OG948_50295 (plasmid) [Embleya sp. NBC_00888]|uniref:hypothetical protein n=1 Tax=Embleya sp. NBC_00888 TaxID=2975960 RepID=UPI002F90B204|nr:hypothetical protein OG948_50295 [Embleya sp. NBC_00888]
MDPGERMTAGGVDRDAARPGEDRIRHRVDDIDDVGQLMRYALAAQLARLERYGISQNAVARGAGSAPAKVTGSLRAATTTTTTTTTTTAKSNSNGKAANRPNTRESVALTGDWLRNLDRAMVALAPDTESLGGLNSLGIRLRGLTRNDSLPAHLPAGWTWEILQDDADTEFAVLIQASALLSLFMPVDHARRSSSELRQKYKKKIHAIAERLALIGGAPPTPRNIDALVLLGSLTKYAYDPDLGDLIGGGLRTSPLGFRHWRVLTQLVHLCQDNLGSTSHLKGWVIRLLKDAEELRRRSVCPGRSLDLELAVAIPEPWSPPEDDWVRDLLLTRATDPRSTTRERGTAALGLWQRTLAHNPLHREDDAQARRVGEVETRLRELVAWLRDQGTGQDAGGLRWTAATLEAVLDAGTPVCNVWPTPEPRDESWFRVVRGAADSLDSQEIPERILQPTKALLLHVLLQNAVVQRRKAIDTLMASGWSGAVVHALEHVLEHEKEQSWLRVRALFAIGFLQRRDNTVAQILVQACKEAHDKLANGPTDAQITEMHAVLFAIGDCFGAGFGARDRGNLKTVRAGTAVTMRELATGDITRGDPRFYPVARALAYQLTFTAQDRRAGTKDSSEELLEALRAHPDDTTREFCEWALQYRFGDDGKVRSLLHAADTDD